MAKGTKTGGGSRKGKPNKDNAAVKEMIEGALSDVGGREYLAKQALDNPGAFLTLIGKVVPRVLSGDPDKPIHHAHKVIWGNHG
jgi:hypothetical protein